MPSEWHKYPSFNAACAAIDAAQRGQVEPLKIVNPATGGRIRLRRCGPAGGFDRLTATTTDGFGVRVVSYGEDAAGSSLSVISVQNANLVPCGWDEVKENWYE